MPYKAHSWGMKCLVINVLFSMDPVVKIHHDPFFAGPRKTLFHCFPRLTSHEWLVKREEDTLPPFFEGFSTHRVSRGLRTHTATLGKIPPPKKRFPHFFHPQKFRKDIFRNRVETTHRKLRVFFSQQKPLG